MIHYRDMMFCTNYRGCMNAGKCGRALTEQVRIEADAWWGKGEGKAPIAYYADTPDCFSSDEHDFRTNTLGLEE